MILFLCLLYYFTPLFIIEQAILTDVAPSLSLSHTEWLGIEVSKC